MSVELVEACGFPDIVGGLFKEYTDMLIEGIWHTVTKNRRAASD